MHKNPKGVVAAGHPQTAEAATLILEAGGNAFDAVVAAHLAACVAEPVLASLGGGGYLLTHDGSRGRLFDFFVHTPLQQQPPPDIDFFPITADFGTTTQEFHIGLGAVATPGVVRGLWQIQRNLGRLPMRTVAEPAIDLARGGVTVNAFQAYIFQIVAPIFLARTETLATYRSPSRTDRLIQQGERLRQPELGDTLEALTREGEALFYEGEIATAIETLCQEGGLLSRQDLHQYRLIERQPLALSYRGNPVLTNPPPSSGGILIAFALKLLETCDLSRSHFGSIEHLQLLTRVQELTQEARQTTGVDETHSEGGPPLLEEAFLAPYRRQLLDHPLCRRGTTQISVMDREGNCASLTTSNGEGCGTLIPGTGIMLNNMLGEEDLNPHGFHHWPANRRMTSMMAPTLSFLDGRRIALGSGGSNRLRTAILQVLINLIDFRMNLERAISSPRLHFERGTLNLESGFPPDTLEKLLPLYPHHLWPDINLYFGGVHAVSFANHSLEGAGDPRRGGCSLLA